MMLWLAAAASGFIIGPWIVAGLMLRACRVRGLAPEPMLRRIFHELRPLYLPAVAIGGCASLGMDIGRGPGDWLLDLLTGVAYLAAWFRYRNEGQDDDRWKRRRRKVAEAVTRAGSRLAVESVPA